MGNMATTLQKCFYFILHIQTEAYCMLADISNCFPHSRCKEMNELVLYSPLTSSFGIDHGLQYFRVALRCMAWFSSSRWTFLQYVSHFGIPSSERVCLFSGLPTGKHENMIWDADYCFLVFLQASVRTWYGMRITRLQGLWWGKIALTLQKCFFLLLVAKSYHYVSRCIKFSPLPYIGIMKWFEISPSS